MTTTEIDTNDDDVKQKGEKGDADDNEWSPTTSKKISEILQMVSEDPKMIEAEGKRKKKTKKDDPV